MEFPRHPHAVQVARHLTHSATIALVQPTGRPYWTAGIRVVLALYAPLLLGLALDTHAFIPVAVGALVGALVDPGCSSARRAWTIGTTSALAAFAFAIGDLAGHSPLAAIPFIIGVAFACGLAPEFGAAGIRGSLYIASAALMGIASTGVDPGYITAPGLLAGGVWALVLAVGPFRQSGVPHRGLRRRTRSLAANLRSHLRLESAIGRHSARIAVAMGLALSLSFALDRPAVSWIAGAALAVLHPRARAHGTRAARLFVGTLVGGVAAVALADLLGPSVALLVALVPALFLSVSMRSVDYVTYTIASTVFMLALSAFTWNMGWGLFDARLIDTVIGVLIALIIGGLSMPPRERERLAAEIDAV